jgi:ABC-type transport system involved in Fe-S cluster assembly fused permease/ATPase subunit
MVDGNDVRRIEKDYLSRKMGMVKKENVMFECYIRDKIEYG